jgi:hypothetical protein
VAGPARRRGGGDKVVRVSDEDEMGTCGYDGYVANGRWLAAPQECKGQDVVLDIDEGR